MLPRTESDNPTDVECVDGDERDKKVLRTRETIILYPKLKIK